MFTFFFFVVQLSARDYLDLNWEVSGDFEEPTWMNWIGFIFISTFILVGLPGLVWREVVEGFDCSKVTGGILTAIIGLPLVVAGIFFVYHCFIL